MIVRFALNLTHEAIALLHDTGDGWWSLGKARFDDPDFADVLAKLRDLGHQIGGPDFATKLILPNSQIFYTTTPASGDDATDREQVDAALDGATPYQVNNLVKDWTAEDGTLNISVVARQTLDEAESFATQHGFNPAAFVGIPETADHPGEPFFGVTRQMDGATDLPERAADPIAIAGVLDQAQIDALLATQPAQTAPEAGQDDAPAAEDKPDLTATEAVNSTADEDPAVAADLPDGDETPQVVPEDPATTDPTFVEATAESDDAVDADPEPNLDTLIAFSSMRRKAAEAAAEAEDTTAPPLDDPAPAIEDVPPTARLGGATRDIPPPEPLPEPETITPSPDPDEPAASAAPPIPVPAALQRVLAERAAQTTDAAAPLAELAPVDPTSRPSFAAQLVQRVGTLRQKPVAEPDDAPDLGVFAARAESERRSGPRIGLALTLGLLGIMAGVGVWSSLFLPSDEDLAALPATPDTETALIDETAPNVALTVPNLLPDDAPGSADPGVRIASLSDEPRSAVPEGQPELSEPIFGEDPDADTGLPDEDTALITPEQPELPEDETQISDDLALDEEEPVVPQADEVRAAHAATGIWQQIAPRRYMPGEEDLDQLYVTSIDPSIRSQDAIALPDTGEQDTDRPVARIANPAPPDLPVAQGADGLVTPSPGGTLAPGGYTVFAGKPWIVPPRRPDGTGAPVTEPEQATSTGLADFRPRPRPANLLQEAERSQLGGRTRIELAALTPRARPEAIVEEAQAIKAALAAAAREAEARAQKEAEELAEKLAAEAAVAGQTSALAVAVSPAPKNRPRSIARQTARSRDDANREVRASASTATTRSGPAVSRSQRIRPTVPTRASVARQATVKNAIRLGRVNLIGVFGKANQRRALVRLPSGKMVRLKIGDRIDGGRVAAIGNEELRYVKGGRNVVLTMPKG